MQSLPLHPRVWQLTKMILKTCRVQYIHLLAVYCFLRQVPKMYLFVTNVPSRMHLSQNKFTCVGPAFVRICTSSWPWRSYLGSQNSTSARVKTYLVCSVGTHLAW